jgi:hypothetical protein
MAAVSTAKCFSQHLTSVSFYLHICSGDDWQPRSRVLRSGARWVYLFIHLYVSTSNIYRFTPPCAVSLHSVPYHTTLYRLTPPVPFNSPCTVSLHPVPYHSTLCRFTPPCTVSLHPVPFYSTLYLFTPPCSYRFTPPCTFSLRPISYFRFIYISLQR